jgi:hypothetical protein
VPALQFGPDVGQHPLGQLYVLLEALIGRTGKDLFRRPL